MRTLALDYESYYDKEYSLRKMTPVEYILDPRFETILCAVKEIHPSCNTTLIVDGPDFAEWARDEKLHDCCLVSHNALFDMCILAWRYGIVPRLMIDTLGVSRAMLGHRLRHFSLAKIAAFLNLGTKGTEINNVIGMNRATIINRGLWPGFCEYSANDAELCAGVYQELVASGRFPISEIAIADMVLRCAIIPKFRLDYEMLVQHHADVKQQKMELLASAMLVGCEGVVDLMSNNKFADLLRSVGCEPPRKVSAATGLWTYAFAKTDKEFIALEDHPDAAVQVLVAARTGHKSTLEETRSERLISIANLTWQGNEQRLMPIPLGYGRAHTHRLGGEWKLNMQNLPRASTLRRALIAPPGHKVIAVDAAQIEARIVAWICEQWDLVKNFADGIDVYAAFASEIFEYLVTKNSHPKERFIGKTSILGLGYQVGGKKFQNTIEVQSQLQLGTKIDMSIEEATGIVEYYRRKYYKISSMWKTLQVTGIQALHQGFDFSLGPCKFEHQAVLLPSGLRLHYHDLAYTSVDDPDYNEWIFTYGEERKKLYGGKLLENIVQALARIVVMDAALRVQKLLGLALQAHDELVYIVADRYVQKVKQLLELEMCRPPYWAPDLPLAAEVKFGQNYGDCK